MLRFALYHPWIYTRGGIERTIGEFVTRSRHEWTVFTSHYERERTFAKFADVDVRALAPVPVERDVISVGKACVQLLLSPGPFEQFSGVVVSCEGIGNLAALRAGSTPLACLCITPLKVMYDPDNRRLWLQQRRPGLSTRAAVRLFAAVDRIAWRRYERILCISNEVKQRVLNAGLAEEQRLDVAYPGVDTRVLKPSGKREPYFLLPSRIKWWKNNELGITAFLELKRRMPDCHLRLVVAGIPDERDDSYLRHLQTLAAGHPDIEFKLWPREDELLDLYDRCLAVVCTTPNEDWGIVAVEGMAFGKPVIAVNRGGTAESIVDGETGLLREPDAISFAEAMARIASLSDAEYCHMSSSARRRSLRYDWSHFVKKVDDTMEEMATEREKVKR